MDYCKGGIVLVVKDKSSRVDPGFHKNVSKHSSESVVSDLSDERSLFTQLRHHRKHVARRAAGISLQHRNAVPADTVVRHINKKLSQRSYIVILHDILPCDRCVIVRVTGHFTDII